MIEEEDAPFFSPLHHEEIPCISSFPSPHNTSHNDMEYINFIFLYFWWVVSMFWARVISLYGIRITTWWDDWSLLIKSDYGYQRRNVFKNQTNLLPVKKYKHEWTLTGRVLCFYFIMIFVEVSALIFFLRL